MTEVTVELPPFDDLPLVPELGLRHAWEVFGDSELGTLGLVEPSDILAAMGLVRDGTVIGLTVPLDAIDPPMYEREPLEHSVFHPDHNTWDDRLDRFFLQASTHWDGLRHIQAREFGHFGGRIIEELEGGSGPLGIEHWARRGIVGRGVLVDVVGHLARDGYDPFVETPVTVETIESIAEQQRVEIRRGDILCLRFGWMDSYGTLDEERRRFAASSHEFAGLAAGEPTARWVWDTHVAAIAADNPGVEVSPGDRAVGSLHRRLIPMLGVALGELFDFGRLAAACRADERWDFLFVSVPLHLTGGVGSPANALAVR